MEWKKWNERLNAIVERLNELNDEEENLEGYGWWMLDCALETREEMYEGPGECPPPTPEELESIKAECERNEQRMVEISDETDKLIYEYYELAGTSPHRYELGGNYARSWNDTYNAEDDE